MFSGEVSVFILVDISATFSKVDYFLLTEIHVHLAFAHVSLFTSCPFSVLLAEFTYSFLAFEPLGLAPLVSCFPYLCPSLSILMCSHASQQYRLIADLHPQT